MATPNSLALDILREMEKATDDLEFVARVEKRVNDALDEIAVATDWNHFRARTTLITNIGQADYTLPPGGREIIQLRYTDTGEPLDFVTIQEAARRAIKLEEPGRARVWLENGVFTSGSSVLYNFRLAPIPDSNLQIEQEFFYHPSDVASGSTFPIQDQLLPLVRRFVRSSLYRLDQKYDASDREENRYNDLLSDLTRREKRKVAQDTRLKASDLVSARRPQAIFDPAHFDNPWL